MEKSVFATRLDPCYEELKWLYCELYHNDREHLITLFRCWRHSGMPERMPCGPSMKMRLADPDWYRSNKLLGMMMYPANFGGNLEGRAGKAALSHGMPASTICT